MQISHFHRRENFITLYWFRNNSLTSTSSFSLHINLSLFKVLSSFFNWLLRSVLYCRLLRDCLLCMQLCLSWHKADICFLHVFRYCLGIQKCWHISLKLNILMVFYNAKYLLYSPWASADFWKWLCIWQIFFLFQNQVCINIEWYNGTASIIRSMTFRGVMIHPQLSLQDTWWYLEKFLMVMSSWIEIITGM